jgi:hypothetical protein
MLHTLAAFAMPNAVASAARMAGFAVAVMPADGFFRASGSMPALRSPASQPFTIYHCPASGIARRYQHRLYTAFHIFGVMYSVRSADAVSSLKHSPAVFGFLLRGLLTWRVKLLLVSYVTGFVAISRW